MTTSLTPVNPFGSIIEGLRLGATIEDRELARQKREQEAFAMEKAQEQERIGLMAQQRFVEDPTYENLIGFVPYLNPQAAKVMQESVAAIGKDRARNQLQSILPIAFAVRSGNTEVAINRMDQIIEGTQDPASKNRLNQLKTILQSDPNYFIATAALGAHESGLPELAKQLLEVGKPKARLLSEDEAVSIFGQDVGRRGRWLETENGKYENVGAPRDLPNSLQEAIDFKKLTPQEQETFRSLILLRKPPADVTNVNVNNVEKTTQAELGKLIPDLYSQANAAVSQLSDIPRYAASLDAAITGPLAEQRLAVARIANALGFTGDKSINATRELMQGLAEMGLSSRNLLTGQGAITENEQKLLIKARSGDINFTKGELQTIFNVAERAARAQYNKSKKLLQSAVPLSPTAQIFLDNIPDLPTGIQPSATPQQIQPASIPLYPGPAPAAAPVPAPPPPAVAPDRPAAGPPGPPAARRPGDKGRDIGGGFRVLTQ